MPREEIGLQEIQATLANAGNPWEAGVTDMSILTPEEQDNRLGVEPPPGEMTLDEVEQSLGQEAAEEEESISAPKAFDLRNVSGRNFVTDVKNQGGCGSCVAFGAAATVESTLRRQRNNANLAIDLSEAHLFYCHARSEGRNCGNGWWPQKAFDWFKKTGVVDEKCYPYTAGDQNCSNLCKDWKNRVVKITDYKQLKKRNEIKEWIYKTGPVSACFIVYSDFYSYKSGIYKHVSGSKRGGHCVTIVGYNDDHKYWICKNSWGKNWGESGFFRIGYGQVGIDTWLNHGVAGIENTGWHTNIKVTALWTINEKRNAWAYFAGLGWRRIANDNDVVFIDMLTQLAMAKTARRPVKFYEEKGVIKQVYVL